MKGHRTSAHKILGPALILGMLIGSAPGTAEAHGFAGKRYFPATLTFDDPVPADELDIQASSINDVRDGAETVDSSGYAVEYAKLITPRVALSVGLDHEKVTAADGSSVSGFNNVEIGATALGDVIEELESAWSYGLAVELGDTGSKDLGVEDFDVYSPAVLFGKGMGDSESQFLRPVAVTGAIAWNKPGRSSEPSTLTTAFSLQYSLAYRAAFVQQMEIPRWLRDSVLLVELPLTTCLEKDCGGQTTGTVNPGIIFFGSKGQLGLEFPIPVNDRTGDSAGVLLQAHLYLDDLFPNTLGKPIFGSKSTGTITKARSER